MNKDRIAVLIVTHNRIQMLKECVAAVKSQIRRPDEIIVIDNGSTDGTATWLENTPGITVVRQENLGAAGGFSRGMREAFVRGHDWGFCIDDDVMLRPDTLELLVTSPVAKPEETGFLACRVVGLDGHTYMTPPPADPFPSWYSTVANGGFLRVANANFAGFMVSRTAIARRGLP